MTGWMWGGELDGWICATSSIRGTNVSTNRNQAHTIVFSLLFFFYFFLPSWTDRRRSVTGEEGGEEEMVR